MAGHGRDAGRNRRSPGRRRRRTVGAGATAGVALLMLLVPSPPAHAVSGLGYLGGGQWSTACGPFSVQAAQFASGTNAYGIWQVNGTVPDPSASGGCYTYPSYDQFGNGPQQLFSPGDAIAVDPTLTAGELQAGVGGTTQWFKSLSVTWTGKGDTPDTMNTTGWEYRINCSSLVFQRDEDVTATITLPDGNSYTFTPAQAEGQSSPLQHELLNHLAICSS